MFMEFIETFPTPSHHDHLDDLAVMAKAIARRFHDRILREELCVEDAVKLGAAFNETARTVRRTILLAEHVADGAVARTKRRTAARRFVVKSVDDAITSGRGAGPDRKRETADLRAELVERIDSLDFERDLDRAELDQLVEALKQDLGLTAKPDSGSPASGSPASGPEAGPESSRDPASIEPETLTKPEPEPARHGASAATPRTRHPAPSG